MVDGVIAGKECRRCGEWKLLSEYSATRRDGVVAQCKTCRLEYDKAWRRANPDKTQATRARAYIAWRIKNPKKPPREPIVSENGRLCRTCEIRKTNNDFGKDRRAKDGLAWRCKECANKAIKEWVAGNIEHVRDCKRKTQNEQYAKNPERLRAMLRRSRLRVKYGMTLEQLIEKLAAQGGGCEICEKKLSVRMEHRLVKGNVACVDHDHATNAVRGILCSHCNRAVGLLRDDPELLIKAASYLRKHGK